MTKAELASYITQAKADGKTKEQATSEIKAMLAQKNQPEETPSLVNKIKDAVAPVAKSAANTGLNAAENGTLALTGVARLQQEAGDLFLPGNITALYDKAMQTRSQQDIDALNSALSGAGDGYWATVGKMLLQSGLRAERGVASTAEGTIQKARNKLNGTNEQNISTKIAKREATAEDIKATVGRDLAALASFVPVGGQIKGSSVGARIAKGVASGAVQGALGSAGAQEGAVADAHQLAEDAIAGAVFGGVLGGGLQGLGEMITASQAGRMSRKVIKKSGLKGEEAKNIKNFYRNFQQVKNGLADEGKVGDITKLKSIVGLADDTPTEVVLKAEALEHILSKHPEEFNQAAGFIKTINFPERYELAIANAPSKTRLNLYQSLADGDDMVTAINRVGLKPVNADGKTYVNTSFISDKPRDIQNALKKSENVNLSSEELPISSSPNGVGGSKLPTSSSVNNDDIISPTNQNDNLIGKIGQKLDEWGVDYSTSGLGNPAKIKQLSDRGTPAPQLMKEYKLNGRDASYADDALAKISKEYDAIGKNSKATVSKKSIIDNIAEQIREITDNPDFAIIANKEGSNSVKTVKALQEQIDQLNQRFNGDSISLPELIQYRRHVVDSEIPKNAFNTAAEQQAAVNALLDTRSTIREAINAAEPRLKKLGMDIGGLEILSNVFASSAARGAARQPISLKALAALSGGAVAGIPGAAAMWLAQEVINSPTGVSAVSQGAQKVGQQLMKMGAKASAANNTIKSSAVKLATNPNTVKASMPIWNALTGKTKKNKVQPAVGLPQSTALPSATQSAR